MLKKITLLLALLLLAAWLLSPWYAKRVAAELNGVSGTADNTDLGPAHPSLVADLHADPLLWRRDWSGAEFGHIDIPRLLHSRVGLQVFGIVTASPGKQNFISNEDKGDRVTALVMAQHWPPNTWFSRLQRARYQIRQLHQLSAANPEVIIIKNQQDLTTLLLRRSRGEALVGALLALEGAHALGEDPANFELLYGEGLRMLGLAHFFDNAFAGSAHGMQQHGLTEEGRTLVRNAQERGVIIDLAHASAAAFSQVAAMSVAPLVVSHTGVDATCPGPRNLSDAQLRAIAESGGVVGIALFKGATCSDNLDGFFAALNYAVAIAGVDHVALGSDFDGAVTTPIHAGEWAAISNGLAAEGYTREEIEKIMGSNVLRILQAVLPAYSAP